MATQNNMERQNKSKRITPLPGGYRRDTSVAGGGRVAGLASDSPLSRRAGVGVMDERDALGTTADNFEGDILRSRDVSPTSSAGTPHPTTVRFESDQERRKWSTEELHELVYCFYKARALGPGYIKRLESIFRARNPNNPKSFAFTGNTLSGQARSVIARKVIPIDTLNSIKSRAEEDTSRVTTPSIPNSDNQTPDDTQTTELTPTEHSDPNITNTQHQTHSRASPNTIAEDLEPPPNISETIGDDRRRKWSNAEMEELMFCYYKARVGGSGYMNRLQRIFIERNPHNPKVNRFNGQSLSTQARTIIKHKMLSQEVLNRIQQDAEVTETIENTEPINHTSIDTQSIQNLPQVDNQTPDTMQTYTPEQTQIIDQVTQNILDSENQDPIILQLLNILSETKEIPISERKLLPKAKINKQFIGNCHKLNKFLPNLLEINTSLREINDIIYATAKTLIVNNNQMPYEPRNTVKPKTNPAWKKRIQKKIENFRKELGKLIEIGRGVSSRRMIRSRDYLYSKYNIHDENDHSNTVELLKQKVKALAGRIKRYEELNDRKEQNKLFRENEHRLYRSLGNNSNSSDIKIPSKDSVEQFWGSILSNPIQYNTDARWIKEIEESVDEVNTVESEEITVLEVKFAIRKLHNWKSPGIDKVQNYYLKYLTSTHKYLAKLYSKIVQGSEHLEDWFTTGQVILIPKNSDTEDPKNWRPIACLPSMYKLLTSVLANVLYSHCSNNNIMAAEQRGCRRGARGCKDHLMVNKAILEDAHTSQKNLSMAWIDYQKAFDSVSHEWLLKILDVYQCPPMIKKFLELSMPNWKVIMTARGTHESITTEPIYIRRGIFQGDSLSPLLFCLAMNPLSLILNKYEHKGYKLKDSYFINHLLYMDDLKLYANNRSNLKVLLDSVEVFTADIGMRFGLDKCSVLHLSLGHRSSTTGEGHVLLNGEEFNELEVGNTYKYLGVSESGKIEHSAVREQVTKEYFKRVKKLLNSHLNSRNIIKGINTYAIPVLMYSFGIINYKNSDLKKIDTKTRKLLNIKKAHQQKADVERLYLPVAQGGRGLLNVENIYKTQIIKYKQYLRIEQDHLIKTIVQHDINKDKYSIIKEAEVIETELQLEIDNRHTDREIKEAIIKKQNERWRNKQLHGQFAKVVLDQANVDIEQSFRWIKKQQVSPSIESSIFAIQDQAVMTRQHQRDILKESVDGKCRLCAVKDETAQHIISGCEKLAGTYYVKRHNNLVQYVYWCLARKHNMDVNKLWWKETLTQPKVVENETAKIMWEIPIQTDTTVSHNRPDLVYTDKTSNNTYLIDITVPSDYNIGAKEVEKLSKYHLLKTELKRIWNTTTHVIPIVIGSTGIIAKSLTRYIEKLDSNIDITILQKQAAIHTTIILSKVLGDTVFVNSNANTDQTEPNHSHTTPIFTQTPSDTQALNTQSTLNNTQSTIGRRRIRLQL